MNIVINPVLMLLCGYLLYSVLQLKAKVKKLERDSIDTEYKLLAGLPAAHNKIRYHAECISELEAKLRELYEITGAYTETEENTEENTEEEA